MLPKKTKKLLLLWAAAYGLRKLINVEALIGTSHFMVITPLLGSFLTLPQAGSFLATFTCLKLFFGTLPITLGIPSMFAVLSWSTINVSTYSRVARLGDAAIHVLLPLTCITLFIMHPTGHEVFAYTAYWFIPIILWAMRITGRWTNPFVFALQSTFVAHAVGSVMWIYMLPTTASYWIVRIPLVAIERLTMASITTLLYLTGAAVVNLVHVQIIKRKSKNSCA